jgi:hypothetical protein
MMNEKLEKDTPEKRREKKMIATVCHAMIAVGYFVLFLQHLMD